MLTLAGGLVKGLSSTANSIRLAMFLNSIGRLPILFALRSSLTSFRQVSSIGTASRRLLRSTKDCSDLSSPKRGGRCVNWLQDASSSVSWDMRHSSSGREDRELFDTSKICNKKK